MNSTNINSTNTDNNSMTPSLDTSSFPNGTSNNNSLSSSGLFNNTSNTSSNFFNTSSNLLTPSNTSSQSNFLNSTQSVTPSTPSTQSNTANILIILLATMVAGIRWSLIERSLKKLNLFVFMCVVGFNVTVILFMLSLVFEGTAVRGMIGERGLYGVVRGLYGVVLGVSRGLYGVVHALYNALVNAPHALYNALINAPLSVNGVPSSLYSALINAPLSVDGLLRATLTIPHRLTTTLTASLLHATHITTHIAPFLTADLLLIPLISVFSFLLLCTEFTILKSSSSLSLSLLGILKEMSVILISLYLGLVVLEGVNWAGVGMSMGGMVMYGWYRAGRARD